MRISRVAQRLAMLIAVVALGVAVTACQGAVGPKGTDGKDGTQGPQGPKGDPGSPGSPGSPGDPGVSPLVVHGGLMNILVNDGTPAAGDTFIPWGSGGTVDVSTEYFTGGYDPVTYALAVPVETDDGTEPADVEAAYNTMAGGVGTSRFKVSVTDGALSYEARDAELAVAETDYTVGTTFHVKATDAIAATVSTPLLRVLRNRAPRAPDSPQPFTTAVVGTQDGYNYPDTVTTDAQKAEYRKDPCNNIMNTCVDIVATASGQFFDEEPDGLMFMVSSEDPTMVSASVSKKKIMVTGLMKTEAIAGTPVPAEVKVSATDRGGLTTPSSAVVTLSVNVDPAPTAVGRLNDGAVLTLKPVAPGNTASIDLSSYFDDESLSGTVLEYSVTVDGKADDSEKPDIVDINGNAGVLTDSNLTITAVNRGRAMIVVKVTETDATPDLGQYAMQTLTVVVEP